MKHSVASKVSRLLRRRLPCFPSQISHLEACPQSRSHHIADVGVLALTLCEGRMRGWKRVVFPSRNLDATKCPALQRVRRCGLKFSFPSTDSLPPHTETRTYLTRRSTTTSAALRSPLLATPSPHLHLTRPPLCSNPLTMRSIALTAALLSTVFLIQACPGSPAEYERLLKRQLAAEASSDSSRVATRTRTHASTTTAPPATSETPAAAGRVASKPLESLYVFFFRPSPRRQGFSLRRGFR